MLFFYEFFIIFKELNIFHLFLFSINIVQIISIKLNFFFSIYFNFNNFNFDILINNFYNSVDYNFYIFYILMNIVGILDIDFIYTINYKDFKTFNFLNNLYIYDYRINLLLQNKLQLIHPLIFILVINYKYFLKTIKFLGINYNFLFLFLLFTFLGLFWSNQNNFWNSWWIWDISEIYIIFLILLTLMSIHSKTKIINKSLNLILLLQYENFTNLIYDTIIMFYIKSHEFINLNSFKYFSYWLIYFFIITDFKLINDCSIVNKIKFKTNSNLTFIFVNLYFILSLIKFIFTFVYINFLLLFLIVLWFIILFIFFKNNILLTQHYLVIFFLIFINIRQILNSFDFIYYKFNLTNYIININYFYILINNFNVYSFINIFNELNSSNSKSINYNLIYKNLNFFNIKFFELNGETNLFFVYIILYLYLLKKNIKLIYY